jgi:hypothetical protein
MTNIKMPWQRSHVAFRSRLAVQEPLRNAATMRGEERSLLQRFHTLRDDLQSQALGD